MARSVFAIDRSLWEDPDFASAAFSQREAWIWLIGAAAWKERKARGNAGTVVLQRGEFSFATRFLAVKWKWSSSRVSRFILMLKKRDMIRDAHRDGSTVYKIRNYNDFQVVGLAKRDNNGTPSGTAAGQQRDAERDKEETIKQDNKKEEERDAPSGAVVLELKPKTVPVKTIPHWLDPTVWAAYCELRRKKRAPMTDHAVNLIFGKLERWMANGHDPTDVLNNSIANGWTGIFEPKAQDGRPARKTKNDNFLQGISDAVSEICGGDDAGENQDDSGSFGEAGRALLPS